MVDANTKNNQNNQQLQQSQQQTNPQIESDQQKSAIGNQLTTTLTESSLFTSLTTATPITTSDVNATATKAAIINQSSSNDDDQKDKDNDDIKMREMETIKKEQTIEQDEG